MHAPAGYRELTAPGEGAVSIFEIVGKELIEQFKQLHLRFIGESSAKLRLAHLLDGDLHEKILVCSQPSRMELHVHGGQQQSARMHELLRSLADAHPPCKCARLWQECMQRATGVRELKYLLKVKKSLTTEISECLRGDMNGFDFLKPVQVVLTGPVNAGKSSLFNRILGNTHALVSEQAGTTRDVIKAELNLSGHRVILHDTAGWQDNQNAADPILERSLSLTRQTIEQCDILLLMDTDECPVSPRPPFQLSIQGKADLPIARKTGRHAVSSLTGEGVEELVGILAEMVDQLKSGQPNLVFHQDLSKEDLQGWLKDLAGGVHLGG